MEKRLESIAKKVVYVTFLILAIPGMFLFTNSLLTLDEETAYTWVWWASAYCGAFTFGICYTMIRTVILMTTKGEKKDETRDKSQDRTN